MCRWSITTEFLLQKEKNQKAGISRHTQTDMDLSARDIMSFSMPHLSQRTKQILRVTQTQSSFCTTLRLDLSTRGFKHINNHPELIWESAQSKMLFFVSEETILFLK